MSRWAWMGALQSAIPISSSSAAPERARRGIFAVSYTHLNSEKRRIFETCYQDNQRRINPLAYWTDSDIWSYSKDVGLEPVSYTHLDVYKRQLKDMEPELGQPRYTTMDVSSAYDAFQEDGQRMAAVSYTHLDVYKRQALPGSAE